LNKNFTYGPRTHEWSSRKENCIIRIWPRPSSIKSLLHIPHRNITDFFQDGNEAQWVEIYEQNLIEIEADGNDLLGQP
ncbi:14335_t:CDS:2, partial [Gigaspora rosea]